MSQTRISIEISDPWELGEALHWERLQGTLLQTVNDGQGGRALVELDKPVSYKNLRCHFVVASPRLEGDQIAEVQTWEKVFCAFIGISDDQARSSAALDTSTWRGGIAFIGGIEKTQPA